MRTVIAALTAGAVLWPAAAVADTVTLKVTDPRDGYEARYDASWRRTAATVERYWLCDRPLWVLPVLMTGAMTALCAVSAVVSVPIARWFRRQNEPAATH